MAKTKAAAPKKRREGSTAKRELTMQDYWDSLSKEEKDFQIALCSRLQQMRDNRERAVKEFDNLTYSQRYEINKQADLGYNSLVGDIDERDKGFNMRTGVTRQKDTSILSHIMSFEFEASIEAFDKQNRIVVELGENTADLVKRSREIEQWKDKEVSIIRELIAQGNVFVEEEYVQKFMFEKDSKNDEGKEWTPGQKITAFKKDEMPLIRVQEDCEANLILGKYVYLASLTQEDIQKQPIVATYREISGGEFSRVYGTWDRAEYVLSTIRKGTRYQDQISQVFNVGDTNTASSYGAWGSQYFWNVVNPGKNVGIVKIYEPFSNRHMVIANGVMLLPIDFPLTKVSPSGLIPLAKGDAEKIQGFAYSKGIPSNTFVDEKMYDFVYQAMAKKLMQSAEPTIANNTGRELPRNWAKPGMAYRGLRKSMIEPLLPDEARMIGNSDVSYFEIVKEIINDKSVDDTFSGGDINEETATVYLERQKNTIGKLFQVIDGYKSLQRQLVRLRIANIYANWTRHENAIITKMVEEVVDGIPKFSEKRDVEKRYRQETIRTKISNENQEGLKIIRFHDVDASSLPALGKHVEEEDDLTDLFGVPVRIAYLHAPSLSRLFDWSYRIEIIPRDTNSSTAEMLAYLDAKQRVANLFGPEVLNPDYTLQRVSEFMKEDPTKAYNIGEQAEKDAMMEQMAAAAAAGGAPAGPEGTNPKQIQSPISQAANAMRPDLTNTMQ